jgi:hypothetical protein
MNIRILRHAAWPALLAAGITSACTSPPPTADAFVESYIQAVSATSQECPFGSRKEWIDIGTPTGLQPTTVADGNAQSGGTVTVACSVHPNGNGFDVTLNASLSGQGSLTITSNSPVTQAGGGMGVTGTFQSAQSGNYTSDNCKITYVYQGGMVPNKTPIAAGRIWAHISCVNAQRKDEMVMAPDGGTTFPSCDTEADFIFENCAQ